YTYTDYDAAGNVIRVRVNSSAPGAPRETTTTFAYDALYRKVGTTEAAGDSAARVSVAQYDAADNMVWTSSGSTGVATSYVYDALGEKTVAIEAPGAMAPNPENPQQQVSSEARTTYTFDTWGAVTVTQNPLTTTTVTYDRLGRAIRTTYNAQH